MLFRSNGALCGGEPVPTWTRLGAVQEALEGDMNGAAKQAVRHFATTEELLFGEFQSFGVSESGTLPGSGRRRGEGTELFGPLDAGTEETAGAMISAGWGDDRRRDPALWQHRHRDGLGGGAGNH